MARSGQSLRLAAIVFTDIVGYSAIIQRDAVLGAKLLDRQRFVVRKCLTIYGGREVETAGDSFLLEFESALKALECVAEIQRRLAIANQPLPVPEQVHIRAGIHLGDVEHRGREVFGDGVNVAARILPLSPPDGVAFSETVQQQVRNRIQVSATSIGSPSLKNIAHPIEIFTLEPDQLPSIQPTSIPKPEHSASFSRSRLIWIPIAGLLGCVITAAALLWMQRQQPIDDAIPSIAVLPLQNESGDAKDDYFSDGLSEDLINALAQVPGLRVIGRSSSFQFHNTRESPSAICNKLHVTHLLEGSVRRQGGRVRIAAELVKCADGAAIWTQNFDREGQDVLSLQSEIAGNVAEQLRTRLAKSDSGATTDKPPHGNLAAYEAYLKGNFLLAPQQMYRDEKVIRQAMVQYQEAIKLEPDYAAALAKLSQAVVMLGNYTARHDLASLEEGRTLARRSLELAPELADAHAAMGFVYDFIDWNFPEAETEYRRALQLAPNNGFAFWHLEVILGFMLKFEEAVAVGRQALAVDPLLPDHYDNLVYTLADQGNFDDAEQVLKTRARLFSADNGFHATAAGLAVRRGQFGRALTEAMQINDLQGSVSIIAQAKQLGDDRKAADAAMLDAIAKIGDLNPFAIAELYAMRREADNAFKWLDRAAAARDAPMIYIAEDPLMKPLRSDSRFAAYCKKVGVPVPSA